MKTRALRRLAALCALLCGASASAYQTNNARWAVGSIPVPYYVDYASISRDMTQATTQQVVEASFASWAAPACSSWRTTNRGNLATGTASSNDGKNILFWHTSSWPAELGGSSVIGVTTPVWYQGSAGHLGTIIDADIQFNGFDYRWKTNPRASNDVDSQSIATHEMGHFLGLNHTPIASAIMYASYSGGQKRNLGQDDINGVCSLYPSGPGSECSSTRACPNGGNCQNGYCIAASTSTGTLGGDCAADGSCGSSSLFCVCTDSAQTNCYCSQDCSTSAPCPTGYACADLQGGGGACVRDSGGSNPTGNGALGDPCTGGNDCGNGLCVGTTGGGGICSQSCSASATCPSGYRCATLTSGSNACVPAAPTPDGGTRDGGTTRDAGTAKALGQECQSAFECETVVCSYLTPDTRLCAKACSSDDQCPADFACAASATGSKVCFPRDRLPTPDDGGTDNPPMDMDAGTDNPPSDNDAGTGGGNVPRRGGGCAQSGGDGSLPLFLLVLGFALVVVPKRRRA